MPVIAFDEAELGERPSRAVAAGRARAIIRGVYTTDLTTPLERLVRANIWEILSHLVSDALIVDRSAGPVLFDGDTLFIASSGRSRDLVLPGLRVAVRPGHPPFADDSPWMAGLRKSSIPRGLVENLAHSRARQGVARTLSEEELGAWVAQLAQQYPADRLNRFRDRARELSAELGLGDRFSVLDDMFGAALGTSQTLHRGLLEAVRQGQAWDESRFARFSDLAERLASGDLDPDPPELPVLVPAMVREQAFFEAYLSNFIEGTEFTVDEAIRIVYDHSIPAARPADAHDVVSTFELISDPAEARDTPGSAAELVTQLKYRHARLMAARPDKHPGQFKHEANRVGSYEFVLPELVQGTLERGFALRDQLTLPFARAAFMMFLVSEVHPFDDGNGRLARLAMNAEFAAADQHRIVIPLIVRNDYISGLRRLSREADPQLLVRVLANAWRWSAQVDFSTLETARSWMERTNALVDATDAERTGKYLILPADITP
jgi:hypothetical protein